MPILESCIWLLKNQNLATSVKNRPENSIIEVFKQLIADPQRP
jgi:hypothetical protein